MVTNTAETYTYYVYVLKAKSLLHMPTSNGVLIAAISVKPTMSLKYTVTDA